MEPSERIVTCVFCGQAYPAGTPTHGAEVLKEHVLECPKHPIQEYASQIGRLYTALAKSLELQSHYANLLNMHDGGERVCFSTVEEWLNRLGLKPPDNPLLADHKRMNALSGWAEDGVVGAGVELDGGVYFDYAPIGGTERSLREKNDLRAAVDAMVAALSPDPATQELREGFDSVARARSAKG